MADHLMSARNAARYLRVPERVFRQSIRPKLRAVRVGRSIVYSRAELDAIARNALASLEAALSGLGVRRSPPLHLEVELHEDGTATMIWQGAEIDCKRAHVTFALAPKNAEA